MEDAFSDKERKQILERGFEYLEGTWDNENWEELFHFLLVILLQLIYRGGWMEDRRRVRLRVTRRYFTFQCSLLRENISLGREHLTRSCK